MLSVFVVRLLLWAASRCGCVSLQDLEHKQLKKHLCKYISLHMYGFIVWLSQNEQFFA